MGAVMKVTTWKALSLYKHFSPPMFNLDLELQSAINYISLCSAALGCGRSDVHHKHVICYLGLQDNVCTHPHTSESQTVICSSTLKSVDDPLGLRSDPTSANFDVFCLLKQRFSAQLYKWKGGCI